VVAIGGLIAVAERSTLSQSVTAFAHLDSAWVTVAFVAEAGSMAAFSRAQRRLLRAADGTTPHLRSVMALAYAANAISVSLPLAGAEVATGFTFRQLGRRGVDPAVAGWALAVSGLFSAAAFAFLVAAGAIASGSPTGAALGVGGAALSLLPTATALASLRYVRARSLFNRVLARLAGWSRKVASRPAPGAEEILERFLERLAARHLPLLEYAEVFALALWNWIADCLCLAAALRATGSAVPWHGLLLAYGGGTMAASIGVTPGGLGVLEAALSAALVAAGVPGRHALAAVLVYRFISFWLVMACGWMVMGLLMRAEHRNALPPLTGGVLPAVAHGRTRAGGVALDLDDLELQQCDRDGVTTVAPLDEFGTDLVPRGGNTRVTSPSIWRDCDLRRSRRRACRR
jgi:uncharacterized protein (TIRG00374 family)